MSGRWKRTPNPPAPPLRRGPAVLLGDGLLLLLALVGAVFSFTSAFALPVRSVWVLAGCCVCAAVYLAAYSLPKFRFVPVVALLGVWALAVERLWDTLSLGEIVLRCRVVNTFAASLGGGGYIRPIAQLPEEAWAAAATLLVLAALVPLGTLLGLAVVRLRSFWAVFFLTVAFPALPLAVSVTPAWLPLMALLLCWGVLLLSSLAGRYDRQGAARLNLLAAPALALVLLLLTLAMPQEAYRRPAWADAANERVTSWAVRVSDRLFPGVHLGGGGIAAGGGEVDLSAAGPLRYSGRTVLDVRTSLRGRLYLRGFSGAVYDGTSWAPLDEEVYTHTPPVREVISSVSPPTWDEADGQPMNFPALADREAFPDKAYARYTVRNAGAPSGYVYYPYQLLTTPEELSGAAFVHDAYLAGAQDVRTHTLYVQPGCSPLSGAAPDRAAAEAEARYASFARAYYLDVPAPLQETLTGALVTMLNDPEAWLPGGAENEHYNALLTGTIRYGDEDARAQAELQLHIAGLVGDYLGVLAQYDPDTPATPEGEDFVEHFLNESRRGYCMHFASAAVLMLRSLDVPARYVSGYVADVPASGRALVPDANAHAWVEIYIDGYGWEPVEVTPAYAGAAPGLSGGTEDAEEPQATPTPAPTAAPTPSVQPGAVTPTPAPTPASGAGGAAAKRFDLRLLLIPALLALVPALLALRRRLARRGRDKRLSGGEPNRRAIEAYLYLQRLARWGGDVPEAAHALAKKAKFSQHVLTGEECALIRGIALEQAGRTDASLSGWRRFVFRYVLGLY